MQLTHNMRNSRHITDFAEDNFSLLPVYSGTPTVLGPPVEVIATDYYDDITIGLGKLRTNFVNNYHTWRQFPYQGRPQDFSQGLGGGELYLLKTKLFQELGTKHMKKGTKLIW